MYKSRNWNEAAKTGGTWREHACKSVQNACTQSAYKKPRRPPVLAVLKISSNMGYEIWAGLRDARSHDLRRTFGSIAADEGYSDATIAELFR